MGEPAVAPVEPEPSPEEGERSPAVGLPGEDPGPADPGQGPRRVLSWADICAYAEASADLGRAVAAELARTPFARPAGQWPGRRGRRLRPRRLG